IDQIIVAAKSRGAARMLVDKNPYVRHNNLINSKWEMIAPFPPLLYRICIHNQRFDLADYFFELYGDSIHPQDLISSHSVAYLNHVLDRAGDDGVDDVCMSLLENDNPLLLQMKGG